MNGSRFNRSCFGRRGSHKRNPDDEFRMASGVAHDVDRAAHEFCRLFGDGQFKPWVRRICDVFFHAVKGFVKACEVRLIHADAVVGEAKKGVDAVRFVLL